MLDGNLRLPRLHPDDAADVPTAGVVGVERQGTIDYRNHRADVLPKKSQRVGCIRQNRRVVARHCQGPSAEIEALGTLHRWIFTGGSWYGSNPRNSACRSRPCCRIR